MAHGFEVQLVAEVQKYRLLCDSLLQDYKDSQLAANLNKTHVCDCYAIYLSVSLHTVST